MRKLVYLLLIAAGIGGVVWKTGRINAARQAPIISIRGEWAVYGKPVDVARVMQGNLACFTVITGVPAADNTLAAAVPAAVSGLLRRGQRVYLDKGCTLVAEVSAVGQGDDSSTGLVPVTMRFLAGQALPPGTIATVFVRTRQLTGVITMPASALLSDAHGSYCWLVRDGVATRRTVRTGVSNNDAVRVLEGLRVGDTVVIRGARILEEGDRVRIRLTGEEQCS